MIKFAIKGDVTRFIGNFVEGVPDGVKIQIKLEIAIGLSAADKRLARKIQRATLRAERYQKALKAEVDAVTELEARKRAAIKPGAIAELDREAKRRFKNISRLLTKLDNLTGHVDRAQQAMSRQGARLAGRLLGQRFATVMMRGIPYVGLLLTLIDIFKIGWSLGEMFARLSGGSGGEGGAADSAGADSAAAEVPAGAGAPDGVPESDEPGTATTGEASAGDEASEPDALETGESGGDPSGEDTGAASPRRGDGQGRTGPDAASEAGEAAAPAGRQQPGAGGRHGGETNATGLSLEEDILAEAGDNTRRVLTLLRTLTAEAAGRGFDIAAIDPLMVDVLADTIDRLAPEDFAPILARFEARLRKLLETRPVPGARVDPDALLDLLITDAEQVAGQGQAAGGTARSAGDAADAVREQAPEVHEAADQAVAKDAAAEPDASGSDVRASDGTAIAGLAEADLLAAVRWTGEALVGDDRGLAALAGRQITVDGDTAAVDSATFVAGLTRPVEGGGQLISFVVLLAVEVGGETRYLNVVRLYRPEHAGQSAEIFTADDGGLVAELKAKLRFPHRDGIDAAFAEPGTVIQTKQFKARVERVRSLGRTIDADRVTYELLLELTILEATGETYLPIPGGSMEQVASNSRMTTFQTLRFTMDADSESL